MEILAIVVVGLFVYLIPTVVAANMKHRNVMAIFVLNLFLGWSLIGWVISLVWAVSKTADSTNGTQTKNA